jgi:hypothetical protein
LIAGIIFPVIDLHAEVSSMGNLENIRDLDPRVIVGIETGDAPYYLTAIAAEVNGRGDDTICNLIYYSKRELPEELQKMLATVEIGGELNGEDVAGVNFLVLTNLSALYQELLEESELSGSDVNLVGLKCMEIGGQAFPGDPAVFSEMINCPVASHFSIDVEGGEGMSLPVREVLLRELVEEMIEKFELEDDAREALGVALLANEALYFSPPEPEGGSTGTDGAGLRVSSESTDAVLSGKFFFPD